MQPSARQRIEDTARRLVAEFAPERIILFGSHAWGHPDEHSDLDLLVVVPESDQPPPRRAARAYRCLREIPVPLDILVKTRDEVERTRHAPASLVHEVLKRCLVQAVSAPVETQDGIIAPLEELAAPRRPPPGGSRTPALFTNGGLIGVRRQGIR